jgi:hypothetical protein
MAAPAIIAEQRARAAAAKARERRHAEPRRPARDVEGPIHRSAGWDVERWLAVPGFEGFYEVSSHGRVRSCERSNTHFNKRVGVMTRCRRAQIKSPSGGPNGYLSVRLYRDGRAHAFSVHALVCRAFLGERPSGQEVRHLDGERHNNRLDNLAYGTKAENAADRRAHGRQLSGRAHPWFKFSDDVVKAVRADRANGLFFYQIAERHGVSRSQVVNMCSGKRSFVEGANG